MIPLQAFLRDLIRQTGVPQAELARRTGLTEKHISEMMNGWSQGTLSAWQALLDVAGVLVPGEPDRTTQTMDGIRPHLPMTAEQDRKARECGWL